MTGFTRCFVGIGLCWFSIPTAKAWVLITTKNLGRETQNGQSP